MKKSTTTFLRLTIILSVVAVIVLFAGFQSKSYAIAKLQLSDGVNSIYIVDNAAGDANPTEGLVSFIGSLGFFNLNVTSGLTYPAIGELTLPEMNLTSVEVSNSNSAGRLTIMFTETGFGPLAASGLTTAIGGTNQGHLLFNTFIDSTNAEFGTGTLIGNFETSRNGAFNNTSTANVSPSSPFSLTTVASLDLDNKKTSSFGLSVQPVVPEPVSSILFLTGVTVLGGRYYFKKKRQAV